MDMTWKISSFSRCHVSPGSRSQLTRLLLRYTTSDQRIELHCRNKELTHGMNIGPVLIFLFLKDTVKKGRCVPRTSRPVGLLLKTLPQCLKLGAI